MDEIYARHEPNFIIDVFGSAYFDDHEAGGDSDVS
jgi:hypothetical protein